MELKHTVNDHCTTRLSSNATEFTWIAKVPVPL